jgi:hypothetical protein
MIDWESFATDLVRDHARLTVPGYAEYERLQKAREEYLTRGHQLMRMSRQCSLEANICYDEAQLIEHQMRGIK